MSVCEFERLGCWKVDAVIGAEYYDCVVHVLLLMQ